MAARVAAVAKKAHQNTHLCITHNKERSSHPFTCSSSEKVECFAPCCACRKNECFDEPFSRQQHSSRARTRSVIMKHRNSSDLYVIGDISNKNHSYTF